MKEIIVLRHGAQTKTANPVGGLWDADAPLSEAGLNVIRQVATVNLAGKNFTRILASPLLRAIQTAEAVAEVLGDTSPEVESFPELGPGNFADWDFFEQLLAKNPAPTPSDCWEFAPAVIEAAGNRINLVIQEVLKGLKDGQSVLFVTHQPLAEATVMAVAGEYPLDINADKGGLFVLSFNEDGELIQPPAYLAPPKP